MKDISIVVCSDLNTQDEIESTLASWSSRGFLKDFFYLKEFSKTSHIAYFCKNGDFKPLDDLKDTLAGIDFSFLRIISLSTPVINNFKFNEFKEYLNAPLSIKLCYLNVIIPLAGWEKNKTLSSGSYLANANILIEPADRPNPLRVSAKITEKKYALFASMNIATIASLWRGQDYGEFDNEKRNQQGGTDFIVTRNFVRLILAPDPVDGLIDSLTTDDGQWIKPNQVFERPSNDLFTVSDFATKIMEKYSSSFNFIPINKHKKNEKISFLKFLKNRYSELDFESPLPFLNQKSEQISRLNEIFSNNTLDEITESDESLSEINKLSRSIVSSLSLRNESSVPGLWRDIRFIIFSLLDGSKIPEGYIDLKTKIILNNSNVIVQSADAEIKNEVSDDENSIETDLDQHGIINKTETSFFDFFTNKLNSEIKKTISNFRELLNNLNDESKSVDETLKDSYRASQNKVKWMDRFLSVYLLNIILFLTNQILINGGYVDIIFTVPILNLLTPQLLSIATLLTLIYWFYLNNQLYKKFIKLELSDNSTISQLENLSKQLVKFQSILNQFELWIEIYKMLIHKTLDKNDLNLDLDDEYVSFAPLHSIKGAIGTIKSEIIREIQDSFIKEGWFYDIYKIIEDQFRHSLVNKILRVDQNLINQIDSETTGFNDKNSIRYMLYEFLRDKQSNMALKNYLQENITKITDKSTADELFSENLISGTSLDTFLGEIKVTENPAEKEFDQTIWSDVSLVFNPKTADNSRSGDIGSTLFSIKAGSPIQRVVYRTDPTERVQLSSIVNVDPEEYRCKTCGLNMKNCICEETETQGDFI